MNFTPEDLKKGQSNPALAHYGKTNFFHAPEEKDLSGFSVEKVALDFIRRFSINGKPYLDVEGQLEQSSKNNAVDNANPDFLEAAKGHFTKKETFEQTIKDNLGPEWVEPIERGHSQSMHGLFSLTASGAVVPDTEGEPPSIKIQQAFPEDTQTNLELSQDPKLPGVLLKTSVARLPIYSLEDRNNVIGFIPGPASATYRLEKQGETWGYQLIEATAEGDLALMLQGQAFKESKIREKYCVPYLEQRLDSQFETYAKLTLAQNNPELIFKSLNDFFREKGKENLSKNEKTLLDFKNALFSTFTQKVQAFNETGELDKSNKTILMANALHEVLKNSKENVLSLLVEAKVLSEKQIQNFHKFHAFNNLKIKDPDFKKKYVLAVSLLKLKSNDEKDKQFINDTQFKAVLDKTMAEYNRSLPLKMEMPKKEWSLFGLKFGTSPVTPKSSTNQVESAPPKKSP